MLTHMGRVNSRSRKILINAPKCRAIKSAMYGMLMTGAYVITEGSRVKYFNPAKHHADVARYNQALKDLRTEGACGVSRSRYQYERTQPLQQTKLHSNCMTQGNLARLDAIEAQMKEV